MESQINENFSEEARLREEEYPDTHLEKLKSSGYVIFKYWMIISALWSIQEIFWPITIKVPSGPGGFSFIDRLLHSLAYYPFRAWNLINCFLVFEAMRRKNLKLISKVIQAMEIYAVSFMIIYFFHSNSEFGRAISDASMQYVPGFKLKNYPADMKTVTLGITLLGWGIYYHFANMYGARKIRDILKAHQRSRHNL